MTTQPETAGQCRYCKATTAPDAKFCNQCGGATRQMTKEDVLSFTGMIAGCVAVFCFFLRGAGS